MECRKDHDQDHDQEQESNLRKRSHRKGPHSFDLHRHREKPGPAVGDRGEVAQVLDDWNAGAEQRGMDWARAIVGAIDVERVDPDESDATFEELFSKRGGQMRVAFEVLVGPPMSVPASVKEHGLSAQRTET